MTVPKHDSSSNRTHQKGKKDGLEDSLSDPEACSLPTETDEETMVKLGEPD